MKPAGLLTKLKDNSNKKWREHNEWQIGKKLGRPKQVWIDGHWEKVK
jgi:hypothetical protein